MKIPQKLSFGLSAAFAAAMVPGVVSAYGAGSQQVSAEGCEIESGAVGNVTTTAAGLMATGGAAVLNCAVPDSSVFPHNTIGAASYARIYDPQAAPAPTVQSCVHFNAGGGACDAAASTVAGYVNAAPINLQPGGLSWVASGVNDYAYLRVQLPYTGAAPYFGLVGFKLF